MDIANRIATSAFQRPNIRLRRASSSETPAYHRIVAEKWYAGAELDIPYPTSMRATGFASAEFPANADFKRHWQSQWHTFQTGC